MLHSNKGFAMADMFSCQIYEWFGERWRFYIRFALRTKIVLEVIIRFNQSFLFYFSYKQYISIVFLSKRNSREM